MSRVERLEVARAEHRYGRAIAEAFAASGSAAARVVEVGDPELWRAVARKVAWAQGHRVATCHHQQHGVVSAILTDCEATPSEVWRAGERLSEMLLGPAVSPRRTGR